MTCATSSTLTSSASLSAYTTANRPATSSAALTSDIDAIQSFIASGLLGALMNSLTLVGMIGVMFYINRQFTLIALSVAPVLFLVVFHFTRRIKKATRDVRKKEGEMVSVIQEVLSSMRVVKAFGREDYEQRRLAEESLESLEIALQRARPESQAVAHRRYDRCGRHLPGAVVWRPHGSWPDLSASARWWSSSGISARCTSPCRSSPR